MHNWNQMAREVHNYLIGAAPFGFAGAVLVAQNGNVLLNEGYGLAVRRQKRPNTADTVFNLGSLTKQFTAAAILKLEQLGYLNTADSIARYLPDVPVNKQDITLHHLLTHTAGLINATGEDYEMAGRDETVKKIINAPLRCEPGSHFYYSNAAYTLLAAIIELVTGEAYEAILHEHLFTPAGLMHTGYQFPEWERERVAHWYVGSRDYGIPPLDQPYPSWNVVGNGEMLSTTGDMYRWWRALHSDRVLPAAAREKLFTPFLDDYAYGWEVVDSAHGRRIEHDGLSAYGSSANFRWLPDHEVLTVLFCNQTLPDGSTPLATMRTRIESLLFGEDVSPPPPLPRLRVNLAEYTGAYAAGNGDQLVVTMQPDALAVVAQGQSAINAIAFPGVSDASQYRELTRRARELFSSTLAGEYEPLRKELGGDEARTERFRRYIDTAISDYQRDSGDTLTSVITEGTLPAHREGLLVTPITLQGTHGAIHISLYWREGVVYGLSADGERRQFTLLFRPLSASGSRVTFAGYHLVTGNTVRAEFERGPDGRVSAAVVDGKQFVRRA